VLFGEKLHGGGTPEDTGDRGTCTPDLITCFEFVAAWSVVNYVRVGHLFLLFFSKKKQVDDGLERFRRSINFVTCFRELYVLCNTYKPMQTGLAEAREDFCRS
jgi:hypothetical protein